MSEELRVDGSLRDTAAVDGEVLLAFPRRVVVNHTRNDLLTHTAFADDEHGEIRRRHLQGNVEGMVQWLAVSYDIVPLFDALKFRCLHFG